MTRRMGWRTGVFFIAFCVGAGLLVGWGITEAQSAEPTTQRPICEDGSDGTSCAWSVVRTKRQGVRKYRVGKVGHAPRTIRYTKRQKRIIVNKLVRVQSRQARTMVASTSMSRAGLWRNFTSNDTCAWTWKPDPGPGTWAGWTCAPRVPVRSVDFTPGEVRGYICGGLAGIGIGGALSASAGGPWVWAGLGAGWAACMWQDKLERQAGS